jgi:hypothetical protein
MELKAIGERQPVYTGEVRLLRDITVGSPAEVQKLRQPDGTIRITGSFRYQACDDKQCFLPETVPVAWTVSYEEFDRQRAR